MYIIYLSKNVSRKIGFSTMLCTKPLLKKGKGKDHVQGKIVFGVALCSCLPVVGFSFFFLCKNFEVNLF